MCILSPDQPHASRAAALPGPARQQLALDALGGVPISRIASDQHVSRKFVYQQLHKAHQGLELAFDPPAPPKDLLFWLPVTKPWLRSLVLGLTLVCHSPSRGVTELLADLFDYPLSLGSVHNIVHDAVARARQVNDREDLSRVRVGAHDEIFQAGRPVLVGVDAHSTYCYLLSLEDQRDGDTWGVRLLERVARGLRPDCTVADFAKGLRLGQEQALPGVPCRGDVFHCLHEVGPLVRFLENRAYDAMATVEKLTRQQKRHEFRKGRKQQSLTQKLRYAKEAQAKAITLADEVAILADWLRRDILGVAGPDHGSRGELLGWVVSELRERQGQCEHRIGPVCGMLMNQGPDLLAFAEQLDKDLAALAREWQVGEPTVREMLALERMGERDGGRWRHEAALRQQLRGRYHGLSEAVKELSGSVVRASSLVENVNSRLRSYFYLRRQLGPDYLELLRFYLNHRRYQRSEREHRVGKSPAELLTGESHGHWLELLGSQRFSRN